jgi:hypothetical protein
LEKERSVICPNCGAKVSVEVRGRLGRKPLNIGVKNICDALRDCRDINLAARVLNCSRGYIYKVLGEHGMKPREVIQGK